MIARTSKEAKKVTLFGSSNASLLVDSSDGIGYILVDTKIDGKKANTVEKQYLSSYDTQAHYCVEGEGIGTINNSEYQIKPGTLIATTTGNSITVISEKDMRIVSIFCSGIDTPTVFVKDLEEICGTERDVFWGNGYSRRFLVRKDGFGFALCVTTGNSGTSSRLHYPNHLESCYYVSGTGEYVWESGKQSITTQDGMGTIFIMNENDPHIMRIEEESVCLSIFTPPIEGHESHNLSDERSSIY